MSQAPVLEAPLPLDGFGDTLARFRALLSARLGLVYDDRQAAMLAELLKRRAAFHALDGDAYLSALEHGLLTDEVLVLAPTLTVAETYFFRNIEQFNALRELVIPQLLGARRTGRSLRVLSAGCATGEEIYTIAMLMQDLTPGMDWRISLLGVDLNPEVLEKARAGRYAKWSLRETPPEARSRWFSAQGSEFVLRPELRAAVRFEQLNLCEQAPEFWRPGAFDLIFARNVLMYFNRSALQAAVGRIVSSLAPDGYLFLGHSESLRDLVSGLQLCHTHDTFYYRREGASGQQAAAQPAAPYTPRVQQSADWVENIGRAAERVRGLTTPVAASPSPRPAATNPLADAMTLFGQERFDAAAQKLDALDAQAARSPDALLLRAALQLHLGELQQAEETAHALLTQDARCAAAHYVIALSREASGDLSAAASRYALAIKVDPGFALSHLQLGRLARRRGDLKVHRHELGRAVALLEHESPQRLLMFGGGFDRSALQRLCRAELQAEGARKP